MQEIVDLHWRAINSQNINLNGKQVLITGAANGIGRAVTIELARRGACVVMLDHKSRHLEKLADQLAEQNLPAPVILPFDLNELDEHSATQIAQAVHDDLGHLDCLLHNAAELGSPSPMRQYDLSYWRQVMQINSEASYLLTRALLPLLELAPKSQVLFTTADCGREPQAYWGAYGIAYAAVEAQMSIWAEELANTSNIKINSLDPGPVRTKLRRRSHPGEDQGQLATPQQLAAAYAWLIDQSHTWHGKRLRLVE